MLTTYSLGVNASDSLQQKVYLHLDKQEYYAGDIIWFRAFVVDATFHKPDTVETTLYTELFNLNGNVVDRKIHKLERGTTQGEYQLPDSLPQGNYLLRAYTLWMLNFGNDFIYERQIHISNPGFESNLFRTDIRNNRRFNKNLTRATEKYKFELFPESRILLHGIENRVAFFASNALGEGIEVEGILQSSDGTEISGIKTVHRGRGEFIFTPMPGIKYQLRVKFPDGKQRRIPIRNILTQGQKLKVNATQTGIYIMIEKPLPNISEQQAFEKSYLVIHSRGKVIKKVEINSGLPSTIKIEPGEAIPGIMVASLFNQQGALIAERLFFWQPQSIPDINLSLNLPEGENPIVIILTGDTLINPISLSFSVTSSDEHFMPGKTNILSYLLLESDLNDPIQQPIEYVSGAMSEKYSDLLMLTTRWERVSPEKSLIMVSADNAYTREKGFELDGIILATQRSKALGNIYFDVSMRIGETIGIISAMTDPEGRFHFRGLKEEGSFETEITIRGINKSIPETVELFPYRFDPEQMKAGIDSRKLPVGARGKREPMLKKTQPINNRITAIGERQKFASIGNPDQIIYIRETDLPSLDMRDLLRRRASGINVDGNEITIRGINSLFFASEPYITVDGIQFSSRQFLQIQVNEISHIEIYKGSSSAIFGAKAVSGAIVAFSRRGDEPEINILRYVINGYHIPATFSLEHVALDEISDNFNNYVQTIFWRPDITLPSGGVFAIRLPITKIPPFLKIELEGITNDGNPISVSRIFRNP